MKPGKNLKKIISVILIGCLLITVIPFDSYSFANKGANSQAGVEGVETSLSEEDEKNLSTEDVQGEVVAEEESVPLKGTSEEDSASLVGGSRVVAQGYQALASESMSQVEFEAIQKEISDLEAKKKIHQAKMEGSGSVSDPYLIYTADDLRAMMENDNSCYKLMCDIDLEGKPWRPVGYYYWYPFMGYLDGNGYKITNLYIGGTGDDAWDINAGGLFGYLEGRVENLGVETVKAQRQGVDFAGYAGGIAGVANAPAEIINCYFNGYVAGAYNAGGIAGIAYPGTIIENCAVIGTVDMSQLFEYRHDNNAKYAKDCFNAVMEVAKLAMDVGGNIAVEISNGDVFGAVLVACEGVFKIPNLTKELTTTEYLTKMRKSNIGGLVGLNYGTINNSYSAAKLYNVHTGLMTNSTNVGAITATYMDGSAVIDCYYDVAFEDEQDENNIYESCARTKAGLITQLSDNPQWDCSAAVLSAESTEGYPLPVVNYVDRSKRYAKDSNGNYIMKNGEKVVYEPEIYYKSRVLMKVRQNFVIGEEQENGAIKCTICENLPKGSNNRAVTGIYQRGSTSRPNHVHDIESLLAMQESKELHFILCDDIDFLVSDGVNTVQKYWWPVGKTHFSPSKGSLKGNLSANPDNYIALGIKPKEINSEKERFAIKNLTVQTDKLAGFFSCLRGTFSDINVELSSGQWTNWKSGIKGRNNNIVAISTVGEKGSAGAIAAETVTGALIRDCRVGGVGSSKNLNPTNEEAYVEGSLRTGGMVGLFNDGSYIKNCEVAVVPNSRNFQMHLDEDKYKKNLDAIAACSDTLASAVKGLRQFEKILLKAGNEDAVGADRALSPTKDSPKVKSGKSSDDMFKDWKTSLWKIEAVTPILDFYKERYWDVCTGGLAGDAYGKAYDCTIYTLRNEIYSSWFWYGDIFGRENFVGEDEDTYVKSLEEMGTQGNTKALSQKHLCEDTNVKPLSAVKVGVKGIGTEAEPLLVYNEEDLRAVAKELAKGNSLENAYIRQMGDIELSADFECMGLSSRTSFKGVYDGNGCKIKNLNISNDSGAALFYRLEGGAICNLTIDNGRFSAPVAAALVVEADELSVISNCASLSVVSSTGQKNNQNHYAAGLVGNLKDSFMVNSYAAETVSSATGCSVAGLVGRISGESQIAKCYTNATLSGSGYKAGISLWFDEVSSFMECYWPAQEGVQAFGDSGVEHKYTDFAIGRTKKTREEMKTQDFVNLLNQDIDTINSELVSSGCDLLKSSDIHEYCVVDMEDSLPWGIGDYFGYPAFEKYSVSVRVDQPAYGNLVMERSWTEADGTHRWISLPKGNARVPIGSTVRVTMEGLPVDKEVDYWTVNGEKNYSVSTGYNETVVREDTVLGVVIKEGIPVADQTRNITVKTPSNGTLKLYIDDKYARSNEERSFIVQLTNIGELFYNGEEAVFIDEKTETLLEKGQKIERIVEEGEAGYSFDIPYGAEVNVEFVPDEGYELIKFRYNEQDFMAGDLEDTEGKLSFTADDAVWLKAFTAVEGTSLSNVDEQSEEEGATKRQVAGMALNSIEPGITTLGVEDVSEDPGDETDFAGGSGTKEDPYLIKTIEQLMRIKHYLKWGYHFKLMNNLDFNDLDGDGVTGEPGDTYKEVYGDEWVAIGTDGTYFTFSGVFDGNGYGISNLTATSSSTGGLFGYCNGVIQNLHVSNFDIDTTAQSAGAIVGILLGGGVVDQCGVEDVTIVSAHNVGGVVGEVHRGGKVSNVYAYGADLSIRNLFIANRAEDALLGGGGSGINNWKDVYETLMPIYQTAVGFFTGDSSFYKVTSDILKSSLAGEIRTATIGGIAGYLAGEIEYAYAEADAGFLGALGTVGSGMLTPHTGMVVGRNYNGTMKNCVGYADKALANLKFMDDEDIYLDWSSPNGRTAGGLVAAMNKEGRILYNNDLWYVQTDSYETTTVQWREKTGARLQLKVLKDAIVDDRDDSPYNSNSYNEDISWTQIELGQKASGGETGSSTSAPEKFVEIPGDENKDGVYEIHTPGELAYLEYKCSRSYQLQNDIFLKRCDNDADPVKDANGHRVYCTKKENGEHTCVDWGYWAPMCRDRDQYFDGELDGNGYTIYGLNVGATESGGLFGYVLGSVHDLNIMIEKIDAYGPAGALAAGVFHRGSIERCSVIGPNALARVKGWETNDAVSEWDINGGANDDGGGVGGLVGILGKDAVVKDCYVIADVTNENFYARLNYDWMGTYFADGLGAGVESFDAIKEGMKGFKEATMPAEKVLAVGTALINTVKAVGNFAFDWSIKIYDSCLGGIVGESRGEIINSYCISIVDNRIPNTHDAALVGRLRTGTVEGKIIHESQMVRNCYYQVGSGEGEYGTELSDADMKNTTSYKGFDFKSTWHCDGSFYPVPKTHRWLKLTEANKKNGTPLFKEGKGTEEDPFIITNVIEFMMIKEVLGEQYYYKLANDIELAIGNNYWFGGFDSRFDLASDLNSDYEAFRGHFDGNGYKITVTGEMAAEASTWDEYAYAGLFPVVSGSITNLEVEITEHFGEDCEVVGGLVGQLLSGGLIENVKVKCKDIEGEEKLGGLVGKVERGATVKNVMVEFTGEGLDPDVVCECGLLVGENEGTVEFAYLYGANSRIDGRDNIFIEEDRGTSSNFYYTTDSKVDKDDESKAVFVEDARRQLESAYSGFDFNHTWAIDKNGNLGLKTLRSVKQNLWDYNEALGAAAEKRDTEIRGTGTEEDPYIIDSANDLAAIANVISSNKRGFKGVYFKQTEDIDSTQLQYFSLGTTSAPFGGNYDGGGKTIYTDEKALFYSIDGAVIKNLNIVSYNTKVRSDDMADGLAYSSSNSLILNCQIRYNNGQVRLAANTASGEGGIVGRAVNTNIINCLVDANFTKLNPSALYQGGLVGNYECDDHYNGDIVGIEDSTMPIISNCVFTGGSGNNSLTTAVGAFGIPDGALLDNVLTLTRDNTDTAEMEGHAEELNIADGVPEEIFDDLYWWNYNQSTKKLELVPGNKTVTINELDGITVEAAYKSYQRDDGDGWKEIELDREGQSTFTINLRKGAELMIQAADSQKDSNSQKEAAIISWEVLHGDGSEEHLEDTQAVELTVDDNVTINLYDNSEIRHLIVEEPEEALFCTSETITVSKLVDKGFRFFKRYTYGDDEEMTEGELANITLSLPADVATRGVKELVATYNGIQATFEATVVQDAVNPSQIGFVRYGQSSVQSDANGLVIRNNGNNSETRKGYIKFDLTGIKQDTAESGLKIKSVKIKYNVRLNQKVANGKTLHLKEVKETTWLSSNLTWNNAPQISSLIKSSDKIYSYSTPAEVVMDVTGYVRSRISSGNTATFALEIGTCNTECAYVPISGDGAPQLIIEWE